MSFDPSRLYVALLNTGLQTKDNPLYQVIYQLITATSGLSSVVKDGVVSSTVTSAFRIPQVDTDPVSPSPGDMWVLKTMISSIPDGTSIGILLGITYTDNSGSLIIYQLSYRTKENTTIRVTLLV